MSRQHILPFDVKVVPDNDKVTARAGLALVVETLAAFGMGEVIKRELKVRQRKSGFTEQAMVEDFAMMLAGGGECVADMKVLGADGGAVPVARSGSSRRLTQHSSFCMPFTTIGSSRKRPKRQGKRASLHTSPRKTGR